MFVRWRRLKNVKAEVFGANGPAFGQDRCPFDHMLQLAYVAGPRVPFENTQYLCGERLFLAFAGELAQEMRRQAADIFPPLRERRKVDGEHRQAIKEVLTELVLCA